MGVSIIRAALCFFLRFPRFRVSNGALEVSGLGQTRCAPIVVACIPNVTMVETFEMFEMFCCADNSGAFDHADDANNDPAVCPSIDISFCL